GGAVGWGGGGGGGRNGKTFCEHSRVDDFHGYINAVQSVCNAARSVDRRRRAAFAGVGSAATAQTDRGFCDLAAAVSDPAGDARAQLRSVPCRLRRSTSRIPIILLREEFAPSTTHCWTRQTAIGAMYAWLCLGLRLACRRSANSAAFIISLHRGYLCLIPAIAGFCHIP